MQDLQPSPHGVRVAAAVGAVLSLQSAVSLIFFSPGSPSLPIGVRVVYASSIEYLGESTQSEARVTRLQKQQEMLQGTLDMLILRTLVMGPAHGHTIAHVIEHSSEDVLTVEQGSLYPALHRLEDRGWLSSYWGVSENNRKARFYRLTPKGKKQLATEAARWRTMVGAIARVMGEFES